VPGPPVAVATDKIVVDGLTVEFGDDRGGAFRAIDDVDLTVADGEFVSIVGRSGCGKTTLFNVIAGLARPTDGHVRVNGELVDGVAGHAGYMLQRDHLFPWRRMLDNVVVGRDVLGFDRAESRTRARELFPRFGLQGFEKAYPKALSGGMRQRAALLRTLLLERDLLLLDEPFGALDAITRGEIHAFLLSIWDEFQNTVVFITHDVDEAVYLSDRVVVMAGPPGRIVTSVDVPISRPRDHTEVVTSTEFAHVKHRVLELIEGGWRG
jgi:ABC-type nitrate/sulfonate/bicarbonate transport system ATPase subunit